MLFCVSVSSDQVFKVSQAKLWERSVKFPKQLPVYPSAAKTREKKNCVRCGLTKVIHCFDNFGVDLMAFIFFFFIISQTTH